MHRIADLSSGEEEEDLSILIKEEPSVRPLRPFLLHSRSFLRHFFRGRRISPPFSSLPLQFRIVLCPHPPGLCAFLGDGLGRPRVRPPDARRRPLLDLGGRHSGGVLPVAGHLGAQPQRFGLPFSSRSSSHALSPQVPNERPRVLSGHGVRLVRLPARDALRGGQRALPGGTADAPLDAAVAPDDPHSSSPARGRDGAQAQGPARHRGRQDELRTHHPQAHGPQVARGRRAVETAPLALFRRA